MAIEIRAPLGSIEAKDVGYSAEIRTSLGNIEVKDINYSTGIISKIETNLEIKTGIITEGIPYDGDYEIIPTTFEQILPTKTKVMKEDVNIHSIPYHDISNESGGRTISIAS